MVVTMPSHYLYTLLGICKFYGFMKPKEKKPETVFRIINRNSGEAVGSYSRAYCDEYDFSSVSEARTANFHGMFEDKEKYKIAKYKVTYTLIEDDCE